MPSFTKKDVFDRKIESDGLIPYHVRAPAA